MVYDHMPREGHQVRRRCEKDLCQSGLSSLVTLLTTGGAADPYLLVTGRPLKTYSALRLYTRALCLSVHNAIVHTPRCDICAKRIVHAISRGKDRSRARPHDFTMGVGLSDRRLSTLHTQARSKIDWTTPPDNA